MVEANREAVNKLNEKLSEHFGREIDITALEYATDIYEYVDNFEIMSEEFVEKSSWTISFRRVYQLEEDFYISIIVTEVLTKIQEDDDYVEVSDVINSIKRVYPKIINVIAYTE